jgi:hypothetical protein
MTSVKKQYPLRIDATIFEAYERWANDEFRSVNAQLEYVLLDALRQAGRLPSRQKLNQDRENQS